MTSNPADEPTDGRVIRRRDVLRTIGGLAFVGTVGAGSAAARGPPGDTRGGPPGGEGGPPNATGNGPLNDENADERTILWQGQGSEHATQDCGEAVGHWHWILTPGGSTPYESVGELEVTFEDSSTQSVQGIQMGNGAYHFHVRKAGGGTIDSASVMVVGGGRNALLTISDGGCEEGGILHWQVDFGEGAVKDPPKYWPDDVMAALGNSVDGVTDNPSLRRQQTDGQLGDVDIVGNEFTFDDDGDPTEVTVTFDVESGGDSRDLHLSSWILPGAFDEDEVDQQTLHDSTVASFDGGDHGELTIDIPPH